MATQVVAGEFVAARDAGEDLVAPGVGKGLRDAIKLLGVDLRRLITRGRADREFDTFSTGLLESMRKAVLRLPFL